VNSRQQPGLSRRRFATIITDHVLDARFARGPRVDTGSVVLDASPALGMRSARTPQQHMRSVQDADPDRPTVAVMDAVRLGRTRYGDAVVAALAGPQLTRAR
jgi:hypothetical protein